MNYDPNVANDVEFGLPERPHTTFKIKFQRFDPKPLDLNFDCCVWSIQKSKHIVVCSYKLVFQVFI